MNQATLDFGSDHRVTEAHRALMRALNDAVDAVSLIVAAGSCGCRTTELSDALSGRTNRYLRVEWMLAIADVSPPDFKLQITKALIGWMGFKPERIKPRTAEEREVARREWMAKNAPAVLAMLDKDIGE